VRLLLRSLACVLTRSAAQHTSFMMYEQIDTTWPNLDDDPKMPPWAMEAPCRSTALRRAEEIPENFLLTLKTPGRTFPA